VNARLKSKLKNSRNVLRVVILIGTALAALFTGIVVGKYNAFPLSLVSALRHGWKPVEEISTIANAVDPTPFSYLAEKADVVVVGDSLSAGVSWREVFPDLEITGRAVSGSTVRDLITMRDSIVALAPSTIRVLIGINDLRWGVPLDAFLRDLVSYIESFSGDKRVIVQSILPVRDPMNGWPNINEKVESVNRALEKWCLRNNVEFIDLRPMLAPEGYLAEEYSIDGVHLSGEGKRRWMEVLREEVFVNE
jgi:lysophospholipase L1-like esterase